MDKSQLQLRDSSSVFMAALCFRASGLIPMHYFRPLNVADTNIQESPPIHQLLKSELSLTESKHNPKGT